MSALFKKCCPQKDPETEYNSDDEKGEEPEVQPDFTKQLEANEGFCRIKKKGRRPRDCPCLVVFLVFLLGLGYVTYHAFARGDPRRLYMPTDYLGRVCGADNTNTAPNWLKLPLNKDCINADKNPKNTTAADLCEEAVKPFKTDLTSRRFLWFMSITDPIRFGGVCVSYCPGAHNKSAVEKEPFCPPELDQTAVNNTIFSKFGFTPNPICTYERADRANLTFPVTDEEQFLQTVLPYGSILRRCIPGAATSTVKQEFNSTIQNGMDNATSILTSLWADIMRSWKVIVVGSVLSLFVSFLFLTFVRCFTGIVVWTTVIFTFFALGGLGAFVTWEGRRIWVSYESKQLSVLIPKITFGIGLGICGIAAIYAVLMLFLFMRIRKAIGIISEATKAISAMPQIVFFPVVLGVLYMIFLIYWIIVSVFLWSAGSPSIENQAVRFTLDTFSQAIFAYHIFAFLWISNLFLAFEFVVVAGAVGTWYWRRDKRLIIADPVLKTIGRTLVFHMGSLAIGSLFVAIIQFIRIIFERAQRKLQQAVLEEKVVKGCIWFARGFLFLFEICVKYINKHAYIQIALYGNSFFYAARNAFLLIARNTAQLGVTDVITTIILFLGRIVIASISALIAYALTKIPWMIEDNDFDTSPILVAILVFMVAFVVASLFMTILSCAVDTILQCFLIDMEMCMADKNRKPYCTSSLSNFIAEAKILNSIADKFNCHLCICLTCDCLVPQVKAEQSDLAKVDPEKSVN